jgi:hypothetical protein
MTVYPGASLMRLANAPEAAEEFESTAYDPAVAAWPRPLLRAADWAKERRRRRYLAAVKRRLRRFNPAAAR